VGVLQLVFASMAGAGALVALIVAYRRQRIAEADSAHDRTAGELLARYYRHPAHVHRALQAGATWEQVAAATGRDEAQARQDYREWAEDEHRLWADYNGEFGIDAAEYAAAIARAETAAEQ
jgi:hypothetical protein